MISARASFTNETMRSMALAALACLGAGCGLNPSRPTSTTSPAIPSLACHDRPLVVASSPSLSATFGPERSNGPGFVQTSVRLRNPTASRLKGLAGPATVIVLDDGVAITAALGERPVGINVDLEPGESMSIPATLQVADCRKPGPNSIASASEHATLDVGEYSVVAWVEVVDSNSGISAVFSGGPWPLFVR